MLHALGWLFAVTLAMGWSAEDPVCPAPANAEAVEIYIVRHAWHAGITLPVDDTVDAVWPVTQDFPQAQYLEAGWGDARYFPHPDPGLGTTLRAALWPTSSALHVAAFEAPPHHYFRTEVVRIRISPEAFRRLVRYLRESHVLEEGEPVPMQSGLYLESRFYRSSERYHLFNNCNHWAARALEAAGCPMAPARALTVEELFNQMREFGEEISTPPRSR